MEQPDDIRAAQERFAKLVEDFDPKDYGKEHPLEPFADHIRSLRAQGASYKVVKHLLEQVDIIVCIATVARFCQARELHPNKKKSAKKSRKRTAKGTRKATSSKPAKSPPEAPAPNSPENPPSEQVEPPPQPSKKKRGPRIANPNDI